MIANLRGLDADKEKPQYVSLKYGRAMPHKGSMEFENSPMIHEQIARLKFGMSVISFENKSVVDWGCGAGYSIEWLKKRVELGETLGFDVNPGVVEFARRMYANTLYIVADGTSDHLSIGTFDVVLCCEMIEHVYHQRELLANICRHLNPGGILFLSTPNRPVFSLGFSPSFVNVTHVKELDYEELTMMLAEHFERFRVFGQRPGSQYMERSMLWMKRWRALGSRLVGRRLWSQIALFRRIWMTLSIESLMKFGLWPARSNYLAATYKDFTIEPDKIERAMWLIAVAEGPRM